MVMSNSRVGASHWQERHKHKARLDPVVVGRARRGTKSFARLGALGLEIFDTGDHGA
jgi:hypothetical protein